MAVPDASSPASVASEHVSEDVEDLARMLRIIADTQRECLRLSQRGHFDTSGNRSRVLASVNLHDFESNTHTTVWEYHD